MMGILRTGGFSIDLLHHAMHVIGSRLLGFSQELYDDTASMPAEEAAAMWSQLADRYPNIAQLVSAISHDEGAVVGGGCDDQFEFELALDLILDGLERLRASEGGRRAEPLGRGGPVTRRWLVRARSARTPRPRARGGGATHDPCPPRPRR